MVGLQDGALPTATWTAFTWFLDHWRGRALPDVVTASDGPPGSAGRQVLSTLITLGLLDSAGRPTLALRQLLRRNDAMLPVLRGRWPELLFLLERSAPSVDVAAAFAAVPATSENTARRFRTFVLAACEFCGVEVAAYRRLGRAAAPIGPRRRSANRLARTGASEAAEQLRREVARYERALHQALDDGDPVRAAAWSAELAKLRAELRAH